MKNVFSKITFALSILALGTFVSSCTCGPFGAPSPSYDKAHGYAKGAQLYRPVNGNWTGHWTPDRAHAEDHLRHYNQQNGASGGHIEAN